MAHLLDSDIVIWYLFGAPDVIALVNGFVADGISISAITYMEVYQGALRSAEDLERLDDFVTDVAILPVTGAIAQRCALVRRLLAAQGKRVRSRALDLLIAATALEHRLTLVTRNTADYLDIPDLALYPDA